jgi:hypothetical protein
MSKGKGWKNEPLRHSLARKGVKTGKQSWLRRWYEKRKYYKSLTPKQREKIKRVMEAHERSEKAHKRLLKARAERKAVEKWAKEWDKKHGKR